MPEYEKMKYQADISGTFSESKFLQRPGIKPQLSEDTARWSSGISSPSQGAEAKSLVNVAFWNQMLTGLSKKPHYDRVTCVKMIEWLTEGNFSFPGFLLSISSPLTPSTSGDE